MLTLQVMLMATLHTRNFPYTRKFSNKVLEKLNVHPEKYLNGSLITQ